jgi:hypothetical protein
VEEPVIRIRFALPWLALLAACNSPPPAPPPAPPPDEGPANPSVPPIPFPEPLSTADPVLLKTRLGNGLTTIAFRYEPGPTAMAEFLFGVLAGADQGKQGLADLAAHLLVASGDATAGRPDLQRGIARLGGNLSIEQGLLTTWFGVRVPVDRWQEALTLFAAALQQAPLGRTQLERAQQLLLEERARAMVRDPARQVTARFLLGDSGPGDHLTALQDRDPGEAVLFQTRNYRPEHSVLALRVPGELAEIGAALTAAVGSWTSPTIAPDPLAGPHGRRLASGLYWAAGPGSCQALLVLPVPDTLREDAPAMFALLNCLTLEGVGGRLERLQHEAELGDIRWESTIVSCGETAALVLSTSVAPERVARLWQVALDARRSLRELPPSQSEQRLARQRARLLMRRAETEANTGLRVRTRLSLAAIDEARLRDRLRDLELPEALGSARVAAFLDLPMAMIVIGGEPPADLADVRAFDLLPDALLAYLPGGAGSRDAEAAAAPWIAKAVDAAGGRDRVARLAGYATAATVVTDGAPPLDEAIDYRRNGTLHRTRTVVSTTVETSIEGNQWSEQVGNQTIQLTPQEAGWRLAEAARHPLAILSAGARGALRFRVLATRMHEDREYAVLEAVGDRQGRLRIQIDSESGLLRTVETWTNSPDGNPTYIVDTWSDHRTVEGLRVPFRRETIVDDGQSRRVTTFSSFRPQAD